MKLTENNLKIHGLLFGLTVLTTLAAGALMAGHDIFSNPLLLSRGFPFSAALLTILGCHEFGHYFYAKKHGVDASLPYFIPLPPPITLIGTLGAFIRIRSEIPRRKALLEIGAAGPIAGFIIAIPVLLYGLSQSTIVDLSQHDGTFILGDSLMFKLAVMLIYPELSADSDILLHPIAFAGWIGLLVTMLNLLPIGQLDGGHIIFALMGENHRKVTTVSFILLLVMGLFLAPNWLVWAGIILILMRKIHHPPIVHFETNLDFNSRLIGFVSLVILVLCFVPVPISISN